MSYKGRHFQIDFDFIVSSPHHPNLWRLYQDNRFAPTLSGWFLSRNDGYHEITWDARNYLDYTVRSAGSNPIWEWWETCGPYDPKYAHQFWRILVETSRVFTDFRSRFTGKVSPVHFFWGGFDLAVTRFSGRPAPAHAGAPNIPQFVQAEAYSHEVSSCGFWPGGGPINEPVFYAYAYPEPQGFKDYSDPAAGSVLPH